MTDTPSHSLNIQGRLMPLGEPCVMGILNVTPDSFYAESRCSGQAEIVRQAEQMVAQGARILDVGACSTRPGAALPTADEEMARLEMALPAIKRAVPQAVISVDTFRATVARRCVEDYGAHIVNDISGGTLDADMFPTIAQLQVPYVLSHTRGTPQEMQQRAQYECVLTEVFTSLGQRLEQLRLMGVCDVIIDPGFGFAKTLEHNYELLAQLHVFHQLDAPLMVGLSRKSMVSHLLHCTPQEALGGTTVLHTLALLGGAHILRVHDVKPAIEAIRIVAEYKKHKPAIN